MKANIKKAIPALVILLILGVAGRFLTVFDFAWSLLETVLKSWRTLLELAVMILLLYAVANLILAVLHHIQFKKARSKTLSTLFSSLIKYAAVLAGFCWGLAILGVNVSTIFASVGVIALIIGFGAESLVADIVTGVFILFENAYNVGDIIEVDGFRGTVCDIGIRTISLEDAGKNIKIINNSDLKNIVNRSNHQSVAVCSLEVSYDDNLEQTEKVIAEILAEVEKEYADVFPNGVEYQGVDGFGSCGVILRFKAITSEEHIFEGRRIINRALKVGFDNRGIALPGMQVDSHQK